jgi:glycosyltransferase involved in cell wall biosynthesis
MTFNRYKYIERSFESLYKRAGIKFDHYVFDDCSSLDTIDILKKLKNKYKFELYLNDERLDIIKSFHKNIKKIQKKYDYYIKIDSDIELLSDDCFKNLIENFNNKISGMTPRIEGVLEHEKKINELEFYNGHVLKFRFPVAYGCFMIFPKKVFESFEIIQNKDLDNVEEKWGVDTMLYQHSLEYGDFVIVEDVSAYHIDNTYGQRRVDSDYFTERKRWCKIDIDEVWFIKASKLVFPKYIERKTYEKILSISSDYDDFIDNCKKHLKDNNYLNLLLEEKLEKQKYENKDTVETEKIKKYKISSPSNYRKDKNIQNGTHIICDDIPEWALNNDRVIIEEIFVDNN